MKLRIIDYIGNGGGGVRFTAELLRALKTVAPDVEFEFVSAGAGLATYAALFQQIALDCRITSIAQSRSSNSWRFDVPPEALENCDVAWFPWVHRHRLPGGRAAHVVGSFHDAIIFTDRTVAPIYQKFLPDERATIEGWLNSDARIVVTAHATVATMETEFGTVPARFDIVPASGAHIPAQNPSNAHSARWPWADEPFVLTPANISPHKNHEVLFRGVAKWGQHPLVLTGGGTDLKLQAHGVVKSSAARALTAVKLMKPPRALMLAALARSLGLIPGRTLHALGYVPDADYYPLLHRAWALVMPTLGEGGGSFPVEEALWAGIPVISADIPVMREHIGRLGAAVLWFDPSSPADLADRLSELQRDYSFFKARALDQRSRLNRRTWTDAATEYLSIFHATRAAAALTDNSGATAHADNA